MKYLIVIDMQKDFITGALGTKEAEAIVPGVVAKVQNYEGRVIFTRDTHTAGYLDTQEGRRLPVEHCIEGEEGWMLEGRLEDIVLKAGWKVYDKPTFGCVDLAADLRRENERTPIDEIELCGLCTDICVISNALILKGFLPEVPVRVDAGCCAGVTPQSHKNALEAMKMCQIDIRNDREEEGR